MNKVQFYVVDRKNFYLLQNDLRERKNNFKIMIHQIQDFFCSLSLIGSTLFSHDDWAQQKKVLIAELSMQYKEQGPHY